MAPGSQVVSDYYEQGGASGPTWRSSASSWSGTAALTCIGNTGPLLPDAISSAINDNDLSVVTAVLSGNRNFEGRINPDVKMNYLASPPLVVAYALAGTMDIDITTDPLGTDTDGRRTSTLRDIWPTDAEIDPTSSATRSTSEAVHRQLRRRLHRRRALAAACPCPEGDTFAWDPGSTYVRRAAVLRRNAGRARRTVATSRARRVLALLGDSVTTDHISPAGNIKAGLTGRAQYLVRARRRGSRDFNSYGSRRGNHEVMIRGTFANIRLRNQLAPGTEGGVTVQAPLGRADHHLRRRPEPTPPRARPWSSWPARSTGREARATGPPRARRCSGCGLVIAQSPTSGSTAPT